jgi:hypothetical protein
MSNVLWRLASPYDAYVSHVARLNDALERIASLSEAALHYEAGLQGSVRIGGGPADPAARANRFREQLGSAAERLSPEEFEAFLAELGGGGVASVESDRERASSRLSATSRSIEDYFATAAHELGMLEHRGYNPARPDIARQLRENHLPAHGIDDYRRMLRDLGARVATQPAA